MGLITKAIVIGAVAIGASFFRQWAKGCSCDPGHRIDDKVVIVTGANTGLGKATAEDLALRGGKVYMACRSVERGTEAAEDILTRNPGLSRSQLVAKQLDLASIKSIREFVSQFKSEEKNLHVLVNNAGVFFLPEGTKTEDGFEVTFGVNHLGHFLLTNLLMDALISAAPSRVVTVSAASHAMGSGTVNLTDPMLTDNFSKMEAVMQSKLANIIFSRELGKRLQGTGVTSYSLHSGGIITDIYRHVPGVGNSYVSAFLQWFFPFLIKTPREGAQTQVNCAVHPSLEAETGKFYDDCKEIKTGVPAASDDDLSVKLWDLSVNLLKLENDDIHEKLRR